MNEVSTPFSEIAEGYDGFLIDQWGVLHDGHNLFPDAHEVMQRLRAAGKTLVVVSNSSRRLSTTRENMARMGLDPDLFDLIETSGEEVWQALHRAPDDFYRDLGRRCLVYQWGKDESFFEGLELDRVPTVEEADFVLMNGTEPGEIENYATALRGAAARGLPMVCANHDFVAVSPSGALVECPGGVARRYEAMGGYVRWHGKPRANTYRRATAPMTTSAAVLAIGDSLFHDIGGAAAHGIDSLFITGGIHRLDLDLAPDGGHSEARFRELCEEYAVRPTFVASRLAW